MKPRISCLTVVFLSLVLSAAAQVAGSGTYNVVPIAPTALASTTWYVEWGKRQRQQQLQLTQTACKTIGHAISLASSGDSIMVAAATYTENLTIGFSLKVIGSGASTTIIDGGGVNTVVTISNPHAHVTLSKLTIRNGFASSWRGIYNIWDTDDQR